MINSYPTVFALGHKAIEGIFSGPVVVEEKIDGSQFSFGLIDGALQCRSHGKQLILDAPEKMFLKAVNTVREIGPLLHPDWIYRGEFLEKPKHNTLAYERTPNRNIIGSNVIQTGGFRFEEYVKEYAGKYDMVLDKEMIKPIRGIQNSMADEYVLFFKKGT